MTTRKLEPIHPGEVLFHDFLEPMGISQYRVAHDISVPARRINEIVHGTRRVTADTALRLSRYFGTSERFWLNLQSRFDLEEQRDLLGARLEKEVTILRAAS
ncbi:MAG: HigA family addiction module antitoxin [Gemmatimonadota bacterium]|nr:HigA family addiction module antitoxin [Gemmatimonadota bacterium]